MTLRYNLGIYLESNRTKHGKPRTAHLPNTSRLTGWANVIDLNDTNCGSDIRVQ
jgi:hypothetical protein